MYTLLNLISFTTCRGKIETSDVTEPASSAREWVVERCSQASDWLRRQVKNYMPEEVGKTPKKSGIPLK